MKDSPRSRSLQGLITALLVFIIVYFLLRTVFLGYARYGPLEKGLGILFLISEAYVMFHAFGFFRGLYVLNIAEKKQETEIPELKTFPQVAIVIPVRHEPSNVLENTVTCCYNLTYPNKNIYIIDDSTEEHYKEEAEVIAQRYGCQIFERPLRHGAKAGAINDCLDELVEKYVVILDVDQNPIDDSLAHIISILEADPKLALVQTPQFYSNLRSSNVALAANMQQSTFYEYVCEAKSAGDAMICCGTNTVIRREALEDVGGFDESTVTEDFATSFTLHLKGCKTLYYNHVNTFGQAPENLGAYLVQQERWSMGNVSVLRRIIKTLITKPSSLKFSQWFEYIITSSYYLVSWAYLFLIFCPVLYIFFNIPSFFMNPVVYGCSFLPYLILATFIFYTSMKVRGYSFSEVYKGQLLLFVALPTYIKGSFFGLLNTKKGFRITAKESVKFVPYKQLLPQVSVWGILLISIIWGVNRFAYSFSPAVAVNVLWIIYHFLLMSSLFYFNEERLGN